MDVPITRIAGKQYFGFIVLMIVEAAVNHFASSEVVKNQAITRDGFSSITKLFSYQWDF